MTVGAALTHCYGVLASVRPPLVDPMRVVRRLRAVAEAALEAPDESHARRVIAAAVSDLAPTIGAEAAANIARVLGELVVRRAA